MGIQLCYTVSDQRAFPFFAFIYVFLFVSFLPHRFLLLRLLLHLLPASFFLLLLLLFFPFNVVLGKTASPALRRKSPSKCRTVVDRRRTPRSDLLHTHTHTLSLSLSLSHTFFSLALFFSFFLPLCSLLNIVRYFTHVEEHQSIGT